MSGLFNRLVAGLLSGVLGVSGGGAAFTGYPEKDHVAVRFEDRVYRGTDSTHIGELALAVKETAGMEKSEQRDNKAKDLYHAILDEYEYQMTQEVLSMLRYYADPSNNEAYEQYSRDYENFLDIEETAILALGDGLKSSLSKVFLRELPDPAWAYAFMVYEPEEDEMNDLYLSEQEGEMDYFRALASPYTFDYKGKTWDFDTLLSDDTLSDDDFWLVYDALLSMENKALGEIYLDMVALRNQEAVNLGYDNYASYAYENIHYRDYTPEDTAVARQEVKDYLAPLYMDLYNYLPGSVPGEGDIDEIIRRLSPAIEGLSRELYEAFRYLVDYHLYDIDMDARKRDDAFTISLPFYNDAFIFAKLQGDYSDYSSLIHEFGHFNVAYRDPRRAVFTESYLDVDELCALAMQALMGAYMFDVFDEETATSMYVATIFDLLENVLEGFAVDEFEQEVYTHPDMTLDEMNALMGRLYYEYGLSYNDEPLYGWVEISHLFENPMYYASYAAAGLGALEIWKKATYGDNASAINGYLLITAEAGTYPFTEAIERGGFDDPFGESEVWEIADCIQDFFFGWGSSDPGIENPEYGTSALTAPEEDIDEPDEIEDDGSDILFDGDIAAPIPLTAN